MKTRLLFAGPVTALCFALAASFTPLTLQAQEKPRQPAVRPETPVDNSPSRYDIEVANGQLLLANLKDRINVRAKWGSGEIHSVDATLRNLVEVLRELHTNANITLGPGLEKIKIGDLKLRSSRLDNELQAIQLASGLKFGVNGQNSETSDPSYLLVARSTEQTRKTEVFNLTAYLQQFGERDQNEVDESVGQIKELVLMTCRELRPDDRDEFPSFRFHSGANLLVVIGQPDALEVARKVVSALQPQAAPVGRGLMPLSARGVSKERRNIANKLEAIRLDSVLYDGLPLSEVVRNLVEESKKRDPEKRGLNFLINPIQPPAPAAAATVDPKTGLPVSSPVEAVDINAILVKINPALVNVRLVDVLDAIVKVAERPIKYSLTDYAVVFSLSAPEVPEINSMPPGAPAR